MISVIIPYWNAAEWIGRCVESLKQPGDFEFILVNDKSKDDSEKIARELADDRFVFVDNQHKKGVSGARNTGLDVAKGDWITFLDADDEMLPGAFDTFNAVIQADRKANIHQLNHFRYNAATDRLRMKSPYQGGWYDLNNLPETWWGVWNKLFRADFVKGVRFNESIQYGEDGLFMLECLAKDGKIHQGDRHLATTKHRFDSPNSLSHIKTDKDVIKQIHAYEKWMLKQEDNAIRVIACQEMQKLWARVERFYR